MLNGSKEKIFHLFGALPPLVQFVREGKLLQNHMQIKYSIIYFSTFSNRNREVIEEQEEVLWRLLSVFFFFLHRWHQWCEADGATGSNWRLILADVIGEFRWEFIVGRLCDSQRLSRRRRKSAKFLFFANFFLFFLFFNRQCCHQRLRPRFFCSFLCDGHCVSYNCLVPVVSFICFSYLFIFSTMTVSLCASGIQSSAVFLV